MTTAHNTGVVYGPGAQVTSGGKTYRQNSAQFVKGTVPPNAPWEEIGVATGAQSIHLADSVADAALTSAAPSALTSTQNATAGAAAQGVGYVQADAQTIATLANALKAAYNAAQTDIAADHATLAATQADLATLRTAVNALVGVVNTLLADLQSAGLMA